MSFGQVSMQPFASFPVDCYFPFFRFFSHNPMSILERINAKTSETGTYIFINSFCQGKIYSCRGFPPNVKAWLKQTHH